MCAHTVACIDSKINHDREDRLSVLICQELTLDNPRPALEQRSTQIKLATACIRAASDAPKQGKAVTHGGLSGVLTTAPALIDEQGVFLSCIGRICWGFSCYVAIFLQAIYQKRLEFQ